MGVMEEERKMISERVNVKLKGIDWN